MGRTHLARHVAAEVELGAPASERRLVQTDDSTRREACTSSSLQAAHAWGRGSGD